MASTGLNEESVEKKFMSVTNTQDSIQSLSLWIIHHKTHYAYIVELWYKVMKKSMKPSHRLTLLYLCNDVVQTCKRKKAPIFINSFKRLLRDATALVRDGTIRPKVERIFNIWEERQVFEKDFVKDLRAILDGKKADKDVFKKPFSPKPKDWLKENARRKSEKGKEKESVETATISSVTKDSETGENADATKKSAKEEPEKDEVPSDETLATFKPADLIDKMRSYKKQASEVENSVKKLSHLKLDASSIEAIKQLKDRAHGNEFSNDFEESCLRLEETAECLDKVKQGQKELMAQLHIAEHFYNQQYSEATIVANAYKNYGSRIGMVKKKLAELVKKLPSPAVTPPPQDASPGSTPPHDQYEPLECDDMEGEGLNGEGMTPPSGLLEDSLSLASGIGSGLENRLSSFLPSLQSLGRSGVGGGGGSSMLGEEEEKERPIPVYIPQPIHSNGGGCGHRPSANHTLTESEDDPFLGEEGDGEDGGSTPLTDEPPTTPVMDEEPDTHSPSLSLSPPPPPPPPHPPVVEKRKENPIDFLSRLISQSQRSSSPQRNVGNGSSSNNFLASFSRLSSQVREPVSRKEEEEEGGEGGSPRPRCWAEWKAEKAVELASRVEPPPNTSLPPPLIPGLMGPTSSLAPLGLPPPPLPVPSLPLIPPPPSSLASLVIGPPMLNPSLPSPSPSSLVPVGVPPPSLPSPSSLGPMGRGRGPPGPVPSIPSLPSPTTSLHVSPIKSFAPHQPPPSPLSPPGRGLPLAVVAHHHHQHHHPHHHHPHHHPVPSPGPPSSPFFEHTSPGQKENWPETGGGGGGEGMVDEGEGMMHSLPGMEYSGDMPFPPVGLRMRGSNSVLKELTPSTEEASASSEPPVSSPPPPPASEVKGGVEEVSAISTLASSPGRGAQGFLDKLKQKHPRGYLPSTYTPNPNLMTLTQGEEEDMDDDDDDDDDEEEEEEEEEEKDVATRIPVLSSVVRRVDPREKRQQHNSRESDRPRDRDSSKYSSSSKHTAAAPYPSASSRRERRYSRDNNHDAFPPSSSYSYRDRRPYDYDSVHPVSSDYSSYSEDPYEDREYDPYSSSSTSRHFQKYGISQGSSSHRSYRH